MTDGPTNSGGAARGAWPWRAALSALKTLKISDWLAELLGQPSNGTQRRPAATVLRQMLTVVPIERVIEILTQATDEQSARAAIMGVLQQARTASQASAASQPKIDPTKDSTGTLSALQDALSPDAFPDATSRDTLMRSMVETLRPDLLEDKQPDEMPGDMARLESPGDLPSMATSGATDSTTMTSASDAASTPSAQLPATMPTANTPSAASSPAVAPSVPPHETFLDKLNRKNDEEYRTAKAASSSRLLSAVQREQADNAAARAAGSTPWETMTPEQVTAARNQQQSGSATGTDATPPWVQRPHDYVRNKSGWSKRNPQQGTDTPLSHPHLWQHSAQGWRRKSDVAASDASLPPSILQPSAASPSATGNLPSSSAAATANATSPSAAGGSSTTAPTAPTGSSAAVQTNAAGPIASRTNPPASAVAGSPASGGSVPPNVGSVSPPTSGGPPPIPPGSGPSGSTPPMPSSGTPHQHGWWQSMAMRGFNIGKRFKSPKLRSAAVAMRHLGQKAPRVAAVANRVLPVASRAAKHPATALFAALAVKAGASAVQAPETIRTATKDDVGSSVTKAGTLVGSVGGGAVAGSMVGAVGAGAGFGYVVAKILGYLQSLMEALRQFGERLNEGNRYLARYNGAIASQFMRLQVADFQRDMQMGRDTQGSATQLTSSVMANRAAWQPFNTDLANLSNKLGTIGTEFNTGWAKLYNALPTIMKPLTGANLAADSILACLEWFTAHWPWGDDDPVRQQANAAADPLMWANSVLQQFQAAGPPAAPQGPRAPLNPLWEKAGQ